MNPESPAKKAARNAVQLYAESLGVSFDDALRLYRECESTRRAVSMLFLAQANPDGLRKLAREMGIPK